MSFFELFKLGFKSHSAKNTDLDNNASEKTNSTITKYEKRINSVTGFPMAKESSIKRSQEMYLQSISIIPQRIKTGNAAYDNEMRILDKVLPIYHLGEVHYKLGEWYKAENDWLSIISLSGYLSAEKLAIMYHKQKRFKDEVCILKDGKKFSNHNKVYSIGDLDNYNLRITKAESFALKHAAIDNSVGYKIKV